MIDLKLIVKDEDDSYNINSDQLTNYKNILNLISKTVEYKSKYFQLYYDDNNNVIYDKNNYHDDMLIDFQEFFNRFKSATRELRKYFIDEINIKPFKLDLIKKDSSIFSFITDRNFLINLKDGYYKFNKEGVLFFKEFVKYYEIIE